MSVHARGKVQFLGKSELLEILDQLTTLFENNSNSPASFHYLPKTYVDSLKKAIIAFEMEVESLKTFSSSVRTGTQKASIT